MAWSPAIKRRSSTGGCAATTGSPTRGPPNSRPRWAVCAPTPPSLLAVWAWPEGRHEGTRVVLGARAREASPRGSRRRRRMSVAATRRSRMEKWYRRLLALYPKDHRREHAEEMVGVLLAADGAARVRAPKPVAWALRFGQHTADRADLVGGAPGARRAKAGGLGAALRPAHRRQRRPRRRRAADPRPDRAEPPQASALAL